MATTSRTCTHRLDTPRSRAALAVLVLLFVAVIPAAAQLDDGGGLASEAFSSGPFDTAVRFGFGGNTSYIEVPHHPDLNPTGGFTFEAWIFLVSAPNCGTLAGKGYEEAWWVGVCSFGLRSYLNVESSDDLDGGTVPVGAWHHIAVTHDGTHRRHYVDGELTAERLEPGSLGTSTHPLRFGNDFHWDVTPDARLDEARLWNVALNQSAINQLRRVAIRSDRPGLVAVWSFDNPTSCATFAKDELGEHDGSCFNPPFIFSETGNPIVLAPEPPAGPWLSTPEIEDAEFKVLITSDVVRNGTEVADCVPDTLCVAGALPNRTEIFLRVIGPRPNGFLWAQGSRFSVSQVEVWVRQESTDQINYYFLPSLSAETEEIDGFNDRFGFLP